jgi:hypothetical protein
MSTFVKEDTKFTLYSRLCIVGSIAIKRCFGKDSKEYEAFEECVQHAKSPTLPISKIDAGKISMRLEYLEDRFFPKKR